MADFKRKQKNVHLKFVDAGKKNSPELAVLCSLESDVATFNLKRSFFNGAARRIRNEALNTAMSFREEFHKRELIVGPVLFEFMCWWEFAARNFKRDLVATEPDVVVVLHSTGQRIPSCAISDSVLERRCAC